MKNFIFLISLIASQMLFSQIDYTEFEGEKGKIKFFKQYPFSNIYDYNIDSEGNDSILTTVINGNYPESLISQKFSSEILENQKDSIVFAIKLKTRLVIEVQNQKHTLISFMTSESTGISVVDYVYNNIWSESTTLNKEIDLMKFIIQNSNANIIFEFYNKRNNDKYPKINKLKPLVKDAGDILNIEKLAKVIRENKESLSEYLDK